MLHYRTPGGHKAPLYAGTRWWWLARDLRTVSKFPMPLPPVVRWLTVSSASWARSAVSTTTFAA